MRLNEIADRPGARKARMRVGRGIGSGKGKTSGAGVKGQKARTGVAIKGFEGGQMPLHRRLPKHGFNNVFAKSFATVNVGRLQSAVDAKKLDPSSPVTAEALVAAGLVRRIGSGVRVLGKGELKAKLDLQVEGASAGARRIVEAAGGSITLTPRGEAYVAEAARRKESARKRSEKSGRSGKPSGSDAE
jgi:large subunit ribosomal protein L15